jgi:hypothetical protein
MLRNYWLRIAATIACLFVTNSGHANPELWQIVQRAKDKDFAKPDLLDRWLEVERILSRDLFVDIDFRPRKDKQSVREVMELHNPELLQKLVEARAVWHLTEEALMKKDPADLLVILRGVLARRPFVEIDWRPADPHLIGTILTAREMLLTNFPQMLGHLSRIHTEIETLRDRIKQAALLPEKWPEVDEHVRWLNDAFVFHATSQGEPISCRTLILIHRPSLYEEVFGIKPPQHALWELVVAAIVNKMAEIHSIEEWPEVEKRIRTNPEELEYQPQGCQSIRQLVRHFYRIFYREGLLLPTGLERSYVACGKAGSGAFGIVKKATALRTGTLVAIKKLNRGFFKALSLAWPPREIELMRRVDHPNVIKLLDTCGTSRDNAIYVVAEFIQGCELCHHVRSNNGRLIEKECQRITLQIIAGVDYLHRCGIAHRDLKPRNILISEEGLIKIIDLGLGEFTQEGELMDLWTGTPGYAAPELYLRKFYSGFAADIWSLGAVIYFMATGLAPFDFTDKVDLSYQWPEGLTVSAALKALIGGIFVYEIRRLTMNQILAHRWIVEPL